MIIAFDDQVDWQNFTMPLTKDEKATFVYQKLKNKATQSQSEVRVFLQDRQIPYTSFVVVNAIHASVPIQYVNELSSLQGVTAIFPNTPFRQEEGVQYEEMILSRSATPEWGILRIRADSVWALGYRGQGVVVAGADTGFDWDHPALRAAYRGTVGDTADHSHNWHDAIHDINPGNQDSIINPMNNPCGLNSSIPCDDGGHGTHTMGTMIGEEGANQIGVAPEAKWIACRNMERGWGSPATYLECMEWFLAPTDEQGGNPDPLKSPHVINNSWACPESEGCNPSNFGILRQAVINLRAAGIVSVVSAGNSGSSCGSVSSPLAIFEESFTVGSININDTIAGSSSRGPVVVDSSMRIKPNISAPGVQVRSSWLGDSYLTISGTSMAGPHVAGVVALMISANPQLAGQVELIETILETTARPKTTLQDCVISGTESRNNTFGYGIVDALAAVEAALVISSVDEHEVSHYQTGPFTLFPNPATTELNIKGDNYSSVETLRIFAPDGRLMFSAHDLALPAQVDVSGLAQGLYFVQVDNFIPAIIHVVR